MDPKLPERIVIEAHGAPVTLALAKELVALHDEDEAFSVVPAGSDRPGAGAHAEPRPVYRQEPGGDLVAPTGRALVRFAAGASPDDHREALEQAGFRIERIPSYAPHAAWVRASTGSIGQALDGLARLQRLPDVEHVEPQLLRRAVRRLAEGDRTPRP